MEKGSLEHEYSALETYRDPYLQAARDNAILTIPALIPPEDNGVRKQRKTFRQPDDSIGARGVNNLASKLLIATLPSGAPVFRLVINDIKVKNELRAAKMGPDEKQTGLAEVQKALSEVERAGMQEIDASGIRSPAFIMYQHMLVAGNYAVYIDPDTGQMRGWPLHSYVVSRDRMGHVLKGIIKEVQAFGSLSPSMQELVKAKRRMAALDAGGEVDLEQECTVFTCVRRTARNRMEVWQEIDGVLVEGSQGSFSSTTCPYMFLRFYAVDGEDYGRAYVSDLYGDLFNANELRRAITTFSRAAAKVVYLVKSNATTKPAALTKAKSGDFVSGNPDDVVALSIDKTQDFNVARAVLGEITAALEISFLLNSAVQRNAERVTATEVRAVMEELDAGLGGVQALLATEFLLPFVILTLARMKRKRIVDLPKDVVRPSIVVGIAALGRSQDLQALITAMNALAALNSVPAEFRERIRKSEFLFRVFASAGADVDGLFMEDEEFQEFQQATMLMQLIQQAGPGALEQVVKSLMDPQSQLAGAAADPNAMPQQAAMA